MDTYDYKESDARWLDQFAPTLHNPANWLPLPLLPAAFVVVLGAWARRGQRATWLAAGLIFGLSMARIWLPQPSGLLAALVAAWAMLLGARLGQRVFRVLEQPSEITVGVLLVLAVGLPLGPVVREMVENKPYQVQWFERARFELHPENQPPFGLLLERLSAEVRDAALAAPGPKLLFIESNNNQLYRANADGSGQTRLPVADDLAPPGTTSHVSQVSVAPDGQRLALIVRVPAAAGNEDAYLLVSDRDGQNRRTLTHDDSGYLSAPAWSPDSKQIVYAQLAPAENRVHLFVVNTDGSGTRQVTSGTTNDALPQWSPDGRTIALLSDPNAANPSSFSYLLAVVPAQGGQPRGVSAEQVKDFQWTPGGNELVFATKDEPTQIVALNPATGAQRAIIKEDNGVFGPTLSPDGSKIAYLPLLLAVQLANRRTRFREQAGGKHRQRAGRDSLVA